MFAPAFHTPIWILSKINYQNQNAATVPLRPHLEKFEIQVTARATAAPDQTTAANYGESIFGTNSWGEVSNCPSPKGGIDGKGPVAAPGKRIQHFSRIGCSFTKV
jgi:hypothetical protein